MQEPQKVAESVLPGRHAGMESFAMATASARCLRMFQSGASGVQDAFGVHEVLFEAEMANISSRKPAAHFPGVFQGRSRVAVTPKECFEIRMGDECRILSV